MREHEGASTRRSAVEDCSESSHVIDVDFEETQPSVAIVSAIADLENVPANDLDFVLHDAVDGEALDRLVTGDREGRLAVTVEVDDYRVCIARDGTVGVTPSA